MANSGAFLTKWKSSCQMRKLHENLSLSMVNYVIKSISAQKIYIWNVCTVQNNHFHDLHEKLSTLMWIERWTNFMKYMCKCTLMTWSIYIYVEDAFLFHLDALTSQVQFDSNLCDEWIQLHILLKLCSYLKLYAW